MRIRGSFRNGRELAHTVFEEVALQLSWEDGIYFRGIGGERNDVSKGVAKMCTWWGMIFKMWLECEFCLLLDNCGTANGKDLSLRVILRTHKTWERIE